jgi:JAB1/Mov34/MPN/PAD-1 ubiquitin protease
MVTAVVHPLVLLSVADHHARSVSKNSQKRVVGVLLGQDNGKVVNVANSFGIPFEEDDKDSKTWFLDHNYIEGMYDMFKKVNGTCVSLIVSWLFRIVTFSAGTNDWMVSFWTEAKSV